MDFWERMKGAIDKGVDSSKDLFGKARERAKDVGERGVIRFEIMQLESQAEKLVAKLGSIAYERLTEEGATALTPDSAEVSQILEEIREVRSRIAEKEAALDALNEAGGQSSSSAP